MTQRIHPNEIASRQGMEIGAQIMMQASQSQYDQAKIGKQNELMGFITREVLPAKSRKDVDSSQALQMIQAEGERLGIDPVSSMKLLSALKAGEQMIGTDMSSVLKASNDKARQEAEARRLSIDIKKETLKEKRKQPRQKAFDTEEEAQAIPAYDEVTKLHSAALKWNDRKDEDRIDQIAEEFEEIYEDIDIDLPGISSHGKDKITDEKHLAKLMARELKLKVPAFKVFDEDKLRIELENMIMKPDTWNPDKAFRGITGSKAPSDELSEEALNMVAQKLQR